MTSIAVYQEILHRFTAIRRIDAVNPALDTLSVLVDEVLGYGMNEIQKARAIIGAIEGISARDALHTAVMEAACVDQILSFDKGFDNCPGINRIS